MKMLIEELQKLVVEKQLTINFQDMRIASLQKEVERLEHLLTPKEAKN